MPSARGPPEDSEPPREKLLPSIHPHLRLPERWRARFQELRNAGHHQSRALEILGEEYGGVPRSTLRYYVIPTDIKREKNYKARYWAKKKGDREYLRSVTPRKVLRTRITRHIDEVVNQVYATASPKTPLSLLEITQAIMEEYSVSITPKGLESLFSKFEVKNGYPLLERVAGTEPPAYRFRQDVPDTHHNY